MKLNHYILKFMSQTRNTEVEDYFNPEKLPSINKTIKNGNYYAVDKFGIPIRLKDRDSRTVNGWTRYQGSIIHMFVNKSLIGSLSDEYIRKQAIDDLKAKYPSTFRANTATHKIIKQLYGDKYEDVDPDE